MTNLLLVCMLGSCFRLDAESSFNHHMFSDARREIYANCAQLGATLVPIAKPRLDLRFASERGDLLREFCELLMFS